ncbi:MFS transporter [Streptomyces sp. NPDC001777]|uniref:MFS transporter n=1 Tax=Streptomyces sp. NPDC001777 TaxID=3364608 RepID=UPI003689795F
MHRSLLVLTAITFLTWIGTRLAAIALPLVALAETGEAWTTGLVGGVAGLPLLTVGWWGRRLRDRLTSGRALMAVMLLQAVGLAVVPGAALAGQVGAVALCVSGLVTGVAGALLHPAQRALVADLADVERPADAPSSAPRWLAWQDLAHRVSMVFVPPLGAWLVVAWGAVPLLWCETVAVVLGAAAVLAVPAAATGTGPGDGARPAFNSPADNETGRAAGAASMTAVLRAFPQLAAGILMAGVGGVCWFGFSLGLAVLGVELEMPGALIAAGMSGYGSASVLASFLVPVVIDRLPRMRTMVVSWAVLGLAFALIPMAAPNLALIAAVAALGGAAMPWGIAALNALISEQTSGAQRRTAFTAEAVLHSGGTSLGLLAGGAVIGWAGAGPVLVATGLVQILAAAAGLLHGMRAPSRAGRTPRERTATN